MIARDTYINLPEFDEYYSFIKDLFEEGKTTGSNQSEDFINYTKLSLARTKRGLKTLQPSEELVNAANHSTHKNWLLITEAWCGDAGNIIPLIANLAAKIDSVVLKVALRDEYPELMDLFLTNGGKSIPVFVALDDQLNYKGFWGPRPVPAQKMVMDYKNQPAIPYPDFQVELQKWYINDHGKTLDKELIDYLKL